jgi:hypothetical protein
VRSSEAFEDGNLAFGRIFLLDSRSLNKISIASALSLPTSKAIDN